MLYNCILYSYIHTSNEAYYIYFTLIKVKYDLIIFTSCITYYVHSMYSDAVCSPYIICSWNTKLLSFAYCTEFIMPHKQNRGIMQPEYVQGTSTLSI